MKKKKTLIRFVCLLLIFAITVAIPATGYFVYAVTRPEVYGESFYAALQTKYDRLRAVKGEKIVVVGGSSVAFGYDSKIMEQELGVPCVNMGLYAAFGFKPMLDLTIGKVKKGDIIVLAPELSSQMFSDYIGYEYLLEAMEKRVDMAFALGTDYAYGFMHELPKYVSNAKKLRKKDNNLGDTVYAKASFDKYGDIIYPRESNMMDGGYSKDNLPEFDTKIITDSFVNMVNDFVDMAESKGATVYFTYCPIDELSIADVSEKEKTNFEKKLTEELKCEIIGSLDDHIMDAGYFYDSNFHTNDAGVVLNTVLLINDLKRMSGKLTATNVEIPKIKKNQHENVDVVKGSENGFVFEITSSGVTLTGLEGDMEDEKEIEVPEGLGGFNVTRIAEGAFDGAKVKTIILPETIKSIATNAFAGADSLKEVYITGKMPEVGSSLFDDGQSAKIYVPKEAYAGYVTDYFWGKFAELLEEYDK